MTYGDAERVEARAHPGEVGRAGVAEVVEEAGRVLGGRPALGASCSRAPAAGSPGSGPGGRRTAASARAARNAPQQRRRTPGLQVPSPMECSLRVTSRRPSAGEEVVGQRHHLDVEVGVGGAQRLHAQLVVLAVAALLGRSWRKDGATYQAFQGGTGWCWTKARTIGAVPSGRSAISLAVAVLEDVHLLAHHLAALADAAAEDADVLDDGVRARP